MDNEIINDEQIAPTIEKVSLKEIQNENTQQMLESDDPTARLIKSVLALRGPALEKALNFVEKKLEKLKNRK